MRRLSTDVRSVLGCPDSTPDELIAIHSLVFSLLERVPTTRSDAMVGWLLDARQEIGAKLRVWAEQELGVRVA